MGPPQLGRWWYTKGMSDTFQLKNPTNQTPRPDGPKHDTLHMAEGLTNCWCMCPKCFLKTPDGTMGVCICRECPCAASYEASKPMYVPRTNSGGRQ